MLKYMKIAAAIAVIKSKPEGCTARQYAEKLCLDYQGSLEQWKMKTESLQQEVLEMRQKLALSELPQSQKADGNDSGVGASLTSEKDVPLFSDLKSSDAQPDQNAKLDSHNSFLQSLLRLDASASSVQSSASGIMQQDILLSTVKSSLETVALWMCKPNYVQLSSSTLQNTVTVLVKLAESTVVLGQEKCTFVEEIIKFAHTIIVAIIAPDSHSSPAHKLKLCQILLALAVTSDLKIHLTNILANCIVECSNHLRRAKFKAALLEPEKVENTYFVFWSFEKLLQQDNSGKVTMPTFVYDQLKSLLEESLLHIFEDFPLFAHYVWRLVGLIDSKLQFESTCTLRETATASKSK